MLQSNWIERRNSIKIVGWIWCPHNFHQYFHLSINACELQLYLFSPLRMSANERKRQRERENGKVDWNSINASKYQFANQTDRNCQNFKCLEMWSSSFFVCLCRIIIHISSICFAISLTPNIVNMKSKNQNKLVVLVLRRIISDKISLKASSASCKSMVGWKREAKWCVYNNDSHQFEWMVKKNKRQRKKDESEWVRTEQSRKIGWNLIYYGYFGVANTQKE